MLVFNLNQPLFTTTGVRYTGVQEVRMLVRLPPSSVGPGVAGAGEGGGRRPHLLRPGGRRLRPWPIHGFTQHSTHTQGRDVRESPKLMVGWGGMPSHLLGAGGGGGSYHTTPHHRTPSHLSNHLPPTRPSRQPCPSPPGAWVAPRVLTKGRAKIFFRSVFG